MSEAQPMLAAGVEAILMVAERAVSAREIAVALEADERAVEATLRALADEYAGAAGARPRGFVLREIATGWRLFSAPAWSDAVGRFVVGTHPAKLSAAALETLAIVAYRQPVTRAQIANVRGVSVDGVVRTLLTHDLIEEAGALPTGAITYRTTEAFVEKMGLASLDDLPALAPYLPGDDELDALNAQVEG
ncbi:SMC-Scp complex subunit ScpB [Nanchangia anserum]|uniref:SMC-Scp complex subunit ScpB n=1 Tax=Nanchangia anserum TaxID=2692125 RepID=A0A8I0G6K5_9ACTO|nr:SMC-Scp complex subunit ScpB [Nanchangia anserum]MBD3688727.1 SMC-Scp complex subunit ScpB [Nanchangia anserum]QOX82471.1 SMC-Scp complex subunit ScpB [Nanchangia anserum]